MKKDNEMKKRKSKTQITKFIIKQKPMPKLYLK